jgi:hypothetical protein
MNPCLPAVRSALFLISQLFPQRLHLGTKVVDDFLEILNYQAQASRVHRSGFDRARDLRGATDRRRSPGEDFPRARTPPGDGVDSITARRALTLLRQPSCARPCVIPSPSPTVPSAARAGPAADTALPSGNTRRHAPGRGRWRF